MSIFDSLKGSKKPIIIIAAAAAAVIIALIFMARGEKKDKTAGNEVISKRIKIDLAPSATTAPGELAPLKEAANKPPSPVTTAVTAPEVKKTEVTKSATTQPPVVSPAPATQKTKPSETKQPPVAVAAPVVTKKPEPVVNKAINAPEKASKKALKEARRDKAASKKTSVKETSLAGVKHASAKKQPAKAASPGTKHAVRAKEVMEKSWAVNVASYPNQKDAEAFRDSLKSAGYNAYITEFIKDGMTWSRVRVGFYHTQTDAKNAGKEIKQKMKLHQDPWIVRPFSSAPKGK